jgi:DNA-binding CsgD family transcriptional regulator
LDTWNGEAPDDAGDEKLADCEQRLRIAMDESDPQASRRIRSGPDDEAGPRVSCAHFEGEEVFCFSVPLPEVRYPEGTTAAEHDVIDLLLDGDTLEGIAHLRGTSVRTVTTQLAEIYRKAGVRSVRQLAAFTTGVDGPWTA